MELLHFIAAVMPHVCAAGDFTKSFRFGSGAGSMSRRCIFINLFLTLKACRKDFGIGRVNLWAST
jgi:hypothetical protein